MSPAPEPPVPLHLDQLIDQLIVAVWIYDLARGRILWANQAALTLWGAADLESLRARDFTPVSEASRLRLQMTLERVHGGERSVEEMWTFYPHGVATTVRCCLSGLRLDDGQRLLLLEGLVLHDADSQKDALRSIEAVRHTPAQITLFSVDGVVLSQNPAAQRVFGPGAAAGDFVSRFVDPLEGAEVLHRLRSDEAVSGEFRCQTREGARWHAVDARLATDPATGRKVIVASQQDITDRVTAQQGLRERSEELRLALSRQEVASHERGLLLANISEGLVMVDSAGCVSPECSAAMAAWFGPPAAAGQLLWDYLGLRGNEAASMRIGWEVLASDVLPLELALDQLPRRLCVSGRTLQIEYRPVLAGEVLQRVMLVLRDVTDELVRRRLEVEQRELLEATDRMLHNRDGFRDFFLEADGQVVQLLSEDAGLIETRRLLHTLKGNSALYGLTTIAALCHEVETRMAETGGSLSAADREELGLRWQGLRERLRPLIGHARSKQIYLMEEEHAALLQAVAEGAPRAQVLSMLRALLLQPVQGKLDHLAGQARELCLRLGKGAPEVSVRSDGLRIPAERFAAFFGALVHVVRNAVDHGLEQPEERIAAGKQAAPRIWLRTRLVEGSFWVEIEDDGRGIDWALLREKARAAGLAAERREELAQALFEDGVSTKEVVTDLSGRGVGLAAVRGACLALGGEVDVRSAPGQGTCFRFRFPASLLSPANGEANGA